ncbi:coiled-coil domain-containing protein [Staphylococcus borealis]|uniref:hypothetical protein n=1 Tax=Staphylococcus borealis TaxID=2742203 RepID=UPI000FF35E5B|nr:hypothetical protein [Staphylococcus borealis]MDM7882594.1 hypothetical protein [Staphylococcus borealis]RIO93243.1 hypothetical protein BUZ39_03135 [Staphylococcus haemolyticus]
MKTNYLFQKYNNDLKERQTEITDLKAKIDETNVTIENLSNQYKDYGKNGDDGSADKTFTKIAKLEDEKVRDIKKLETKQELFNSIKHDKLVDLLLNRKEVSKLYKDEVKQLSSELNKSIDQFNTVIEKINNINDEYQKDMHKFDAIIDQNEMKKDDTFRCKYGELIALYLNHQLINTKSINFNEHRKLEVRR